MFLFLNTVTSFPTICGPEPGLDWRGVPYAVVLTVREGEREREIRVSPRSFSTELEPRYVTSNKCELACWRSRTANTPALLVRRASGECGEEATRRK